MRSALIGLLAAVLVAFSVLPLQAVDGDAGKRAQAEQLVLEFWRRVWSPPADLQAVDDLVVEDFVLTSAGSDLKGRDAFKAWIEAFQKKAKDVEVEAYETFANADATRATSRWRATGINGACWGPRRMVGQYHSRALPFGKFAGRRKSLSSPITGSSEAPGNCTSS